MREALRDLENEAVHVLREVQRCGVAVVLEPDGDPGRARLLVPQPEPA